MRGFLLFVLMLFGQVPGISHAAAIHGAAMKGDVAAITAALDSGADVNAIDMVGASPLYWAAQGGHLTAAKLLIERGADVNAKTNLGQPLQPRAAHTACLRRSTAFCSVSVQGAKEALAIVLKDTPGESSVKYAGNWEDLDRPGKPRALDRSHADRGGAGVTVCPCATRYRPIGRHIRIYRH